MHEDICRVARQPLSSTCIRMLDYSKDFALFCCERDGCALSVLMQTHGMARRPVTYLSVTLDSVAAALPGCLKAVAATCVSLEQSESIVMGHQLKVYVPNSIEILLTQT